MQKSVSNERERDGIAAGFFVRLAAYSADWVIIGLLLGWVKLVVFFAGAGSDNPLFTNILFGFDIFDILFYLLGAGYFVLFTCFSGTTPGKRIFNLSVIDEEGRTPSFFNILYRETIGRYLSAILCIGYLLIFISKDKRGLHDILGGTRVIYSCKVREQVIRQITTVPQYAAAQYGQAPMQQRPPMQPMQQPVQPYAQPMQQPSVREDENRTDTGSDTEKK